MLMSHKKSDVGWPLLAVLVFAVGAEEGRQVRVTFRVYTQTSFTPSPTARSQQSRQNSRSRCRPSRSDI